MGWKGTLTYRQYLAWNAWFDFDFEIPKDRDYYIMQLTDVVTALSVAIHTKLGIRLPDIDANKWRISLKKSKPEEKKPKTEREIIRQSRQDEINMLTMLGLPVPEKLLKAVRR